MLKHPKPCHDPDTPTEARYIRYIREIYGLIPESGFAMLRGRFSEKASLSFTEIFTNPLREWRGRRQCYKESKCHEDENSQKADSSTNLPLRFRRRSICFSLDHAGASESRVRGHIGKVIACGTDEQNEQISVKLSNDAVTLMLR